MKTLFNIAIVTDLIATALWAIPMSNPAHWGTPPTTLHMIVGSSLLGTLTATVVAPVIWLAYMAVRAISAGVRRLEGSL